MCLASTVRSFLASVGAGVDSSVRQSMSVASWIVLTDELLILRCCVPMLPGHFFLSASVSGRCSKRTTSSPSATVMASLALART